MAEAQPKRSMIQAAVAKFSAYFEERGLGPSDIPAAVVIHEVVGLFMAISFWVACHAVQPSRALARPLGSAVAGSRRGAALQKGYNAAMAQATATVQNLSWLGKVPGADPGRLTVSLAESLCLRAAIKPLTFPFKLWAAYKLTAAGKQALARGSVQSGGTAQAASGTANSGRRTQKGY